MAKAIARLLEVEKISDLSNEVRWRGGLAVIKSCGPRTSHFLVTANMLLRIDAILVACEAETGGVEVFELQVAKFQQEMTDSRSSGSVNGRVKQVRRATAEREGASLRRFSAAEIAQHVDF